MSLAFAESGAGGGRRIAKAKKYQYIGEHIPISPTPAYGLDLLQAHGGNTAQIFTRSPQGYSSSKMSPEDAAAFGELAKSRGIRVFIHAPYVVNFAKMGSPQDRGLIISELVLATHMGAGGVVIHMGKSTSAPSLEAAHENMVEAIVDVITRAQEALGGPRTKLGRTMAPLLLENPAG
jgi:deoxyribonuclease-4